MQHQILMLYAICFGCPTLHRNCADIRAVCAIAGHHEGNIGPCRALLRAACTTNECNACEVH